MKKASHLCTTTGHSNGPLLVKVSMCYLLWISSDRFFLASSNFCFCCLSSADAERDWKVPPCLFSASGRNKKEKKNTSVCSEGDECSLEWVFLQAQRHTCFGPVLAEVSCSKGWLCQQFFELLRTRHGPLCCTWSRRGINIRDLEPEREADLASEGWK